MDHVMFDQTIDPSDPAVFEVTRRLEAYADLRLSPSAAATTRMRTTVMGAAHRRAALTEADATLALAARAATAGKTAHGRGARSPWRRPVAAAFAATLTLGIVVGTVSAAQPGGPLYDARMWVETAALPADPMARADAEGTRLEARVLEVQAASDAGDARAAQAAVAAYAAIADEAEAASAGDPAATAAIEAIVARHLAVLTLLADRVPAAARTAIEHAVASSTKFLDGVEPAGGGTTNGNHGAPPPGGGSTAQPTPTPTSKPDRPAATSDPGKPAVTPKPGKSPTPSPAASRGSNGHDGTQPSK